MLCSVSDLEGSYSSAITNAGCEGLLLCINPSRGLWTNEALITMGWLDATSDEELKEVLLFVVVVVVVDDAEVELGGSGDNSVVGRLGNFAARTAAAGSSVSVKSGRGAIISITGILLGAYLPRRILVLDVEFKNKKLRKLQWGEPAGNGKGRSRLRLMTVNAFNRKICTFSPQGKFCRQTKRNTRK